MQPPAEVEQALWLGQGSTDLGIGMGMILEKLSSTFGVDEEKSSGENDNNNCSSDETENVPLDWNNITNGRPGSFSQSSWSQCITAQPEINLMEVGRRQSQGSEVTASNVYYKNFEEDYCLSLLFNENENQEDDVVREGPRRVRFDDNKLDADDDVGFQVYIYSLLLCAVKLDLWAMVNGLLLVNLSGI